ncbi:hypothetical protein FXO38_29636 [Capsicum annuum]|nr:hypothetical protein FXO38_29636 [Capsicum annuum]
MDRGNKRRATEGDRFVSAERYDLTTVLDDVGSFPTKISVRSRLKMFNEFKQVVVDQRLKYRPAYFGLKEFALITGLNCGRYPRDSRYVKAMEEGEAFYKKIVKKRSVNAKRLLKLTRAFPVLGRENGKSTEDPTPIPRLLRWHTSEGDKLIEGDPYLNGWSTKACLEGMTAITSSEDGEDGDDDRNLGENAVSKHVTQGAGTSKSRASGKTPMIENLKERVFRLEESIKNIADFVKEKKLRRAEKGEAKEKR